MNDTTSATSGPRNRFLSTSRGKGIIAVGAVIVVAILTGVGVIIGSSRSATPSAGPSGEADSTQGVSLSPEERDFISGYKSRYTDPIAVFNSEAAYLKANPGQDLTVGQDYFTGYDMGATPSAAVSPLGFAIQKLLPGQAVTVDNTVAQFNASIPFMNRFMNLLAKNPLPDQVAVIEDEFNKYAGFNNPDASNLSSELAEIVQKHGSNAVYVINKATTDSQADPAKASYLDPKSHAVIDDIDPAGAVDMFHNAFQLSISVTSYDKNNKSTAVTEKNPDFAFSVRRAEAYDPVKVGLIGIGSR